MTRSRLPTTALSEVKQLQDERRRLQEAVTALRLEETILRDALSRKRTDPVPALSALYQGEKTDASYIFNTAMAMMGFAVAYLVGATPFVEKVGNGPYGWAFLLLLPMPLWLIATFHSLITLSAMSHGISVRIIENALFAASELRVDRDLVGSAAGDKIMDITQSKAAHKIATFVVYGGVTVLIIGFTAYTLYYAWNVMLVRAPVVEIAIALYSILAVIVALSWLVGLRSIGSVGRDRPLARGSDLAEDPG